MKKISILVLSIIAIITLLASCNLDSTDGIGTLVRNDQYEESFRTSHVIGVGSDTIYVKTDKGIRRYAKNDEGTKYTFHDDSYAIENAKGAICMDDAVVLYEGSEGYFYRYEVETKATQTDPVEIKSTTDSIKMKYVLDSYSTDGKYFTIIFQGENGDTYLATLDLSSTTVAGITSSSFDFKDLTSIEEAYRDNITIVGENAIKYSTTHGTSTGEAQYYYTTDIDSMTFHTMSNSTYQKKFIIGAINVNNTSENPRIAIDLNGRVYSNEEYLKQPLSSTIVTKLPIVSDGTRTLCIYSGRVIYAEGTGTDFNSKTASNLSSTMVPIMIKKSTSDTNLYLVFTELSGAYVYNFSDNTMTSLAKKNTSYSLSDFI